MYLKFSVFERTFPLILLAVYAKNIIMFLPLMILVLPCHRLPLYLSRFCANDDTVTDARATCIQYLVGWLLLSPCLRAAIIGKPLLSLQLHVTYVRPSGGDLVRIDRR